MPQFHKLTLFAGAGIGAFAVLLLIISIATPAWVDDGKGNTVGLFRKCVAANASADLGEGCHGENRVTQGGLSVFGLLLLIFGIFATIAAAFTGNTLILLVSLGLMYFSSMFVMSAYATWGVYSRDPYLYLFPNGGSSSLQYTSMGYSYNLCVAAHFFLWTALTLVAFGVGHFWGSERNASG
ncbi:unnamed protein product [Rotaria sp. Silwood2]|nr:unnamed protein product [Rotaria sp. Silwood2]CAF2771081.1 unnamed protein product [Rotaria sp. Silwood2]CAF3016438.1 unnamed protein product [Rotaria sp. Silwood2]CAF3160807.1 unnamed protein product [Rotaria sp. Silwood2]CAF3916446.1 unnamed protein product [Rotaria sp. Silwood2]